MFVVKGKNGKVIGRYPTREAAARRIAQLQEGARRLAPYKFGRRRGVQRSPGVEPWSPEEAKRHAGVARQIFAESHYDHGRTPDPDNCSACAIRIGGSDGPNYAGWARLYIEAKRPIPIKWKEAFEREQLSDTRAYANALARSIATFGPPRWLSSSSGSPTHVVTGSLPNGNVEWTKIPSSARVVEMSHGWAVHFKDGRVATAFWGGNDAREAQTWLRNRSLRDARRTRLAHSPSGKGAKPKPTGWPLLTPEVRFRLAMKDAYNDNIAPGHNDVRSIAIDYGISIKQAIKVKKEQLKTFKRIYG